MNLIFKINDSTNHSAAYLTWTPVKCTIITDSPQKQIIKLKNKSKNEGRGQVVFIHNKTTSDELTLTLNPNEEARFDIAGKFCQYSSEDYDTIIEITDNKNKIIAEKAVMVRIRKNANNLTPDERDRFLRALVRLKNERVYDALQSIHIGDALYRVHFKDGFLSWHRAFLLDLERNLQKIDPSVTIPYWNFNEKAPFVFTPHFMGLNSLDRDNPNCSYVRFADTNPLITNIGFSRSIDRVFSWDPQEESVNVKLVTGTEHTYLDYGKTFQDFAIKLEENPHRGAHSSFIQGPILDLLQAARDPLFFLLHANIDRLWAKWQWTENKFNPADPTAYPHQGESTTAMGQPTSSIRGLNGDFSGDVLWPWDTNAITFPVDPSGIAKAPGPKPTIASMIDFQGCYDLKNNLNFAYDDVPYVSSEKFPTLVGDEYKERIKIEIDENKRRRTEALNIFFKEGFTDLQKQRVVNNIGIFQEPADIRKAYAIFNNTEISAQLRSSALRGLVYDLSNNQEKIKELIEQLDLKEPSALRHLILMVLKSKVNNMTENRGPYIEKLKKLAHEKDVSSELKDDVVSILIFEKDESTQKELINDLKEKSKNPLIDPVYALQLLSYDAHSETKDLYKQLAADGNSVRIRIEAVRNLSEDATAIELLNNIFKTEKDVLLRFTAVSALAVLDPKKAKSIIRSGLMKEENIRLKTLLLNMLLCLPPDVVEIDSPLEKELENIAKNSNNASFIKLYGLYIGK